jgi:FKBP-type peptidyl-prolyl cis-trans isomerase SlyD
MKIAENRVVTIDYTLTDEKGEVLDTSDGGTPLSYLQGAGNIIPGLEQALDGKDAGDKISVDVAPADGYGDYDPGLVFQIEKGKLPQEEPLQEGMQFQADTPDGPRILTLTGLSESEATLDANHPLAGQNLHFDVEVREVREASDEEVSHGHIHGDGDDHHH